MAINRTAFNALVNDDGSNSVGSVVDKAEYAAVFLDPIDAEIARLDANIAAAPGGAWVVPAFSAADFTASGAMTWTVDAGDVTTYAYILRGKTVTVRWYIDSTTVGGTPAGQLRIKIPGGLIAKEYAAQVYFAIDNGGAQVPAYCFVAAGGTVINCYPNAAAAGNWAAATNATGMRGTFTFEVQ